MGNEDDSLDCTLKSSSSQSSDPLCHACGTNIELGNLHFGAVYDSVLGFSNGFEHQDCREHRLEEEFIYAKDKTWAKIEPFTIKLQEKLEERLNEDPYLEYHRPCFNPLNIFTCMVAPFFVSYKVIKNQKKINKLSDIKHPHYKNLKYHIKYDALTALSGVACFLGFYNSFELIDSIPDETAIFSLLGIAMISGFLSISLGAFRFHDFKASNDLTHTIIKEKTEYINNSKKLRFLKQAKEEIVQEYLLNNKEQYGELEVQRKTQIQI